MRVCLSDLTLQINHGAEEYDEGEMKMTLTAFSLSSATQSKRFVHKSFFKLNLIACFLTED